MSEPRKTALFERHRDAGARLVDFAGWAMPLHYGSQLDEHHVVRRAAGVFDVSHMRVVDLRGPGTRAFLRMALANDVARLDGDPGKALYGCMLDADGGILDDLITYFLEADWYRLVVNAATAAGDIAHLRSVVAGFDVTIEPRDDLAMLAVQGPEAVARGCSVLPDVLRGLPDLGAFRAVWSHDGRQMAARTGYTGEDGFEWMLPADDAGVAWDALVAAGVRPVGLGARDTLRLEAGMHLYGQDMDSKTSPLATGLGWTVAFSEARDFIGRAALECERAAGVATKLVGLVFDGRGVLRAGMDVMLRADSDDAQAAGATGRITSGSFSPSLGVSIALARVPAGWPAVDALPESASVVALQRGRELPVRMVRPSFVRHGSSKVSGLEVAAVSER